MIPLNKKFVLLHAKILGIDKRLPYLLNNI